MGPRSPPGDENMAYVMVLRTSPSVPDAYERMGIRHMEKYHKTYGEPNAWDLFGNLRPEICEFRTYYYCLMDEVSIVTSLPYFMLSRMRN
jgi:hypothetical protein